MTDIRCVCGVLLARDENGKIEIKRGDRKARGYALGKVLWCFDCPKCNRTTEYLKDK